MNAKIEFLEETKGRVVKCAEVSYMTSWVAEDDTLIVKLPIEYSDQDLEEFLKKLDFEYDNGYGIQYLYGTIWYTDGTWSERYEYDGSEIWLFKSCPPIPDSLTKNKD